MAQIVDYYLSLQSPWTYLGAHRLEAVLAKHGARARVQPMRIHQIFQQTGGLPLPKRSPERQAYRLLELRRWSAYLDIPLNLHPAHFPTPESTAARMVLLAQEQDGDALRLAHRMLTGCWVKEEDLSEPDTLKAIAEETGHDGETLLKAAEGEDAEGLYDAATEAALKAGVFGAPSYVVAGELFWGQDRIDFLDRRLAELD